MDLLGALHSGSSIEGLFAVVSEVVCEVCGQKIQPSVILDLIDESTNDGLVLLRFHVTPPG